MPRQKKPKPQPVTELEFVTDVPVSIKMRHDGAHWVVERVLVCDEDVETDLKHMKVIPYVEGGLLGNTEELPHDHLAVVAAHNALLEEEWPAWEFG